MFSAAVADSVEPAFERAPSRLPRLVLSAIPPFHSAGLFDPLLHGGETRFRKNITHKIIICNIIPPLIK